MKILVTGSKGQLGQAVVEQLKTKKQYEIYSFGKDDFDITNETMVNNIITSVKPDWILHCAAYTNVEAAEDEGKELNWEINVVGSANIAKLAKANGAKLIYISTDYVFDGTNDKHYEVEDSTNPINEYGRAKLAGEKEVLQHCPNAYIIRTSWVFGENGHNFVYTMLKLSKKMDKLKVVNDQYGRPTYAPDLAAFMIYLVDNNSISPGIYHFSNENECTWYEFATEILKDKNVVVEPCTSDEFPQKAARPKHSVLSLEKVKSVGFEIPTWQNALSRFLQNVEQY
ncbi:dTDP-4-dehydrorhamnose reductase [Lederbergia wuyishanensis]|uniref:dTDP-4-dehydrorhamnose reductase n=1 Tax=Lederbergia wuyishanensis TaxID=1347903 RepID=A0ABU0D367_9BACI|nr:dTDP-4-dehydrorhamnose reductase [Lederbergia wuyishanensis]MCJ8007982.1 dTDP-4-dehydrorhamnose reductase [Lederbergia wuyishanensis]MDQ0342848.1 dTDP-4-dehydrorhamnose reductase [Lederbergia wuyishanensis]